MGGACERRLAFWQRQRRGRRRPRKLPNCLASAPVKLLSTPVKLLYINRQVTKLPCICTSISDEFRSSAWGGERVGMEIGGWGLPEVRGWG